MDRLIDSLIHTMHLATHTQQYIIHSLQSCVIREHSVPLTALVHPVHVHCMKVQPPTSRRGCYGVDTGQYRTDHTEIGSSRHTHNIKGHCLKGSYPWESGITNSNPPPLFAVNHLSRVSNMKRCNQDTRIVVQQDKHINLMSVNTRVVNTTVEAWHDYVWYVGSVTVWILWPCLMRHCVDHWPWKIMSTACLCFGPVRQSHTDHKGEVMSPYSSLTCINYNLVFKPPKVLFMQVICNNWSAFTW